MTLCCLVRLISPMSCFFSCPFTILFMLTVCVQFNVKDQLDKCVQLLLDVSTVLKCAPALDENGASDAGRCQSTRKSVTAGTERFAASPAA